MHKDGIGASHNTCDAGAARRATLETSKVAWLAEVGECQMSWLSAHRGLQSGLFAKCTHPLLMTLCNFGSSIMYLL